MEFARPRARKLRMALMAHLAVLGIDAFEPNVRASSSVARRDALYRGLTPGPRAIDLRRSP